MHRRRGEKYMQMRKIDQRADDTDCRKAEAFYRKNRKAMDAGAEVANKYRFITSPGEDGKPL